MPHATQHADVATAELDSALRGGPFHVALRAAIAARGLPLQRVQHHLSRHGVKVGVTSLSYWQQGARRPQRPESLRAVRALEEILRAARGVADPAARRGPTTTRPGSGPRPAPTAPSSRPPASWTSCWPSWTARRTAACTPSATTSGCGSGRGASWPGASRTTSCAPTGTASTASSPSTTATRGAVPERHGGARPGELPHGTRPLAPRHGSARGRAALRHPAAGRGHLPVPLRRRGRHGGCVARVRPRLRLPGRPVRAPGALRRGGPAGALPPLRPALCGGAAQRLPGPGTERTAPVGRTSSSRGCGPGSWGSAGSGSEPSRQPGSCPALSVARSDRKRT